MQLEQRGCEAQGHFHTVACLHGCCSGFGEAFWFLHIRPPIGFEGMIDNTAPQCSHLVHPSVGGSVGRSVKQKSANEPMNRLALDDARSQVPETDQKHPGTPQDEAPAAEERKKKKRKRKTEA
eukprot:4973859-Amphidinium_carterae.1